MNWHGHMATAEVGPVSRDFVHLRSHTDARNHGVRVGKRGFPKGKSGCCCLEDQEGEMGGEQGRHQQQSSGGSPPPPHPCILCWCPGEGVLPASFQPSQGGPRREHLVPLGTAHLGQLSSQEASSPQPLSLSSQKFFTLVLHGDPREVRTFGFLIAHFFFQVKLYL